MSGVIVDTATFRRLCRSRDLIHADPAARLGVGELAAAAGLSRFHFLRLFRDVFGVTPHRYVTQLRLERARAELRAGRSVTEACLESGFSSLGSFSALFSRRFGGSPRAYQRALRPVAQVPGAYERLMVPACFLRHFAG